MLILDNTNYKNDKRNIYVALGSFDGLHLGHLSLVNKAKELAQSNNGHSMVFTFKNHPRTLIKPDKKLDLIMTNDEKIKILEEENVDILAFKNFDEKIMKMEPKDFIAWLCNDYSVKGIIVGFNFQFGYKNLGDVKLLKECREIFEYELFVMEPYIYKGDVVSSTRIRRSLLNGDIENTTQMLSRPYSITGTVIHGKKLGRTLGFPTANISIPSNKIVPKIGVYYTNIEVNEKIYKGITSVGHNPTVNGKELTIETYILNFDNYIYDKKITVFFLELIRNEIKFNNVNELVSQLQKDKSYAENSNLIIDKK